MMHLTCLSAQALRDWEESMDVWYALPCTDKGAVEELLPLDARLKALAGHVDAIMVRLDKHCLASVCGMVM
jgi:hypothetical protein